MREPNSAEDAAATDEACCLLQQAESTTSKDQQMSVLMGANMIDTLETGFQRDAGLPELLLAELNSCATQAGKLVDTARRKL